MKSYIKFNDTNHQKGDAENENTYDYAAIF